MKPKSTLLTCYLALTAFINTSAQVIADFTMDNASGCSPLTVNFTNKSTGSGTLTYSWVLGNGNTSTLDNPKAAYSDPGTYEVTLTVTNGPESSSVKKSITVHKSPKADFTADKTKSCNPASIQFTDASTKGDANITKWNWDFRNGDLKTDQNPKISFLESKKYDVFLEITDANGCKSQVEKKSYIDVVNAPTVRFYATPATSCTVPVDVAFTNTSIGDGILTYLWDFGGGKTSTAKNPTQTYSAFGNYNVYLKVTTDYGCFSELNAPSVSIGEVNAVGSLKQGSKVIQNNSIVCAGDIDFKNESIGATNLLWDFGDGTSESSASGKHSYPDAGTYKIQLIVAPGDNCADTATWNITVEKAVAGFNMTPETSCLPSTEVTLTNQSSTNITSYLWTYDDGSTSTASNPKKTFTQPADKDQYVIHEITTYPIKLVVTSQNGCKDSTEKTFTVHQPTALFTPSVTEGCAPLTVTFTDGSISTDPINTKTWNWGEGTPQTSPLGTITHTYNTPGTYQVKLTVGTSSGCSDQSAITTIQVGSQVVPDFSVNNTNICSSQQIQFTNLTPAGPSRWHYFIGGKSIPVCPGIENPAFYMKTDIGSLPVTLTVDYNGCISETTKPGFLTNNGPRGSFNYTVNCNAARNATFTANAQNAASFKWELGDGTVNTTDLSLTHTYAAENNYTVKFIVVNGACSDTTIRIVKIRDHQPSFTMVAETCADNMVTFNSSLSHKLHESCSEKYLWNFGDSAMFRTKKDVATHSFTNGGTYDVKLYAFYDDGCVDSISKPIRVYKPVPGFTTNRKQGCAPLFVTFTDTSTPDVHPIISWNWSFGDGNTSSYTSKINSLDNVFLMPGEFTTTLTIQDDFGCIANFEDRIATAIPSATFSAITTTQICAGSEVNFLLDYPDPDSAIWNFGNGNVIRSITKPTKFLYTDSGSFDVSLTLYKFGCSDHVTYNDFVQVQKADARFTVSDTAHNCYPWPITFSHTAGNNKVLVGKWYYGHGDNSSPSYTPTTTYNYSEPGVFKASLELQTEFGCADTFSRSIKITGPRGDFDVTPTEACKGTEITYTLKDTSNVYNFEWDLGDGNLVTGNPVKHKYNSTGQKIAKLILYGDFGKCIPPAVEDSVHIYEVEARISVEDTSVCEGSTIEFNNVSIGADTYKWDLGDGNTSESESVQHTHEVGTYKVSLMASGLYGCKDTAVQYIIVSRYPTLSVSNDTSICNGDSALLFAISDNPIAWTPATDLNFTELNKPYAKPLQSLYYVIQATDPLSQCFRKDSVHVYVQQEPVIELEIEDTDVIAGRPVQITANTEEGATFLWTPSDFLSCNNCYNPVSTTRTNTDYLLKVTDKNNCFTVEKAFTITVGKGDKSFDVPTAFSPSGDIEANKVFRIQGYNIKQVLEFKIYNRWGNMVFSSTDQSVGWDGTYQGKAQPVDSYVYTVKIETFDGNIETKTGTVLLLR